MPTTTNSTITTPTGPARNQHERATLFAPWIIDSLEPRLPGSRRLCYKLHPLVSPSLTKGVYAIKPIVNGYELYIIGAYKVRVTNHVANRMTCAANALEFNTILNEFAANSLTDDAHIALSNAQMLAGDYMLYVHDLSGSGLRPYRDIESCAYLERITYNTNVFTLAQLHFYGGSNFTVTTDEVRVLEYTKTREELWEAMRNIIDYHGYHDGVEAGRKWELAREAYLSDLSASIAIANSTALDGLVAALSDSAAEVLNAPSTPPLPPITLESVTAAIDAMAALPTATMYLDTSKQMRLDIEVEETPEREPDCCDSPRICEVCEECSGGCGDCDCVECQRCDVVTMRCDVAPCGEHCTSCCRCYQCRDCDVYVDGRDEPRCDNCHRCPDCCSCVTCPSCDERVRSNRVCSNCDRCSEDCCTCNDDDDDDDNEPSTRLINSGMLTFHEAKRGEFKENISRRFISLELEFNSSYRTSNLMPVVKKWRDPVVEDGSLDSGGFEICTNPSSGDKFLRHIEELCEAAHLDEADASQENCGMHCHIGAGEYGYFDLFKLCRLYKHVEKGLFRIVRNNRYNGRYSLVCGDTYPTVNYGTFSKDIVNAMYGRILPEAGEKKYKGWKPDTTRKTSVPVNPVAPKLKAIPTKPWDAATYYNYGARVAHMGSLYYAVAGSEGTAPGTKGAEFVWTKLERGDSENVTPAKRRYKNRLSSKAGGKYEDCRYRALNIHSFFYRGTIEFRHHQGTRDATEATHWGMVCAAIVDAGSRWNLREIDALADLDPTEALKAVVPQSLHEYIDRQQKKFPRKKSRPSLY